MSRLVGLFCGVLCLFFAAPVFAQVGPPECPGCYEGWSRTDVPTDIEKTFSFSVTGGMRYDILLFRDSTTGNVDLYSDDDSGVSQTQFDCAPLEAGSDYELCTVEPTSNGTHYAMVHAEAGDVDYTLYVIESDASHTGNPGDLSYCSTTDVCGWELGDCDSDAECAGGLTCVSNVGAEYGWPSYVDVCRGG